MPAAAERSSANQVFKFSPDGKLLLTLGKRGGNPPGPTPRIPHRSISRTT
jgi:hypothetical protein